MVLHRRRLNLNDYDPDKCSIAGGNPCDACMELAELEAGIGCPSDLYDFAQKSRIVKEKINSHHDLLIQHFPVEIIVQIFTRCVEDINPRFLEETTPTFSKANCSGPLILAAVCRTWREIAFTTPQLWATVNIYIYSLRRIRLQEELTRQWLARSGQLPLTIAIYRPIDLDQYQSNFDYRFQKSPLFDAVREYAPRWQRLALRIPSSYWSGFIGDLIRAPSLESLHLFLWPDVRSPSHPFHLQGTPLLTDLLISNIYLNIVNIQWSNLTVFQMAFISIDEIFEVLRRAGGLEKCDFTEIYEDGGSYPLPTVPITCQALKDLTLEPMAKAYFDFRFLLDHLVLPHLDRFAYSYVTEDSRTISVENLISLFSRSQCVIKTFKFEGPTDHTTDDNLIPILEHLSSLRRLSLTSWETSASPKCITWITNQLFKRFQGSEKLSTAKADFLPHLEDLEISGSRAFSWGCFLNSMNSGRLHILDIQVNGMAYRISPDAFVPSTSRIPETQRRHLNVTLNLAPRPDASVDYIDSIISPHPMHSDCDKGVSLHIFDETVETDLIQTTLLFHGLAVNDDNENMDTVAN